MSSKALLRWTQQPTLIGGGKWVHLYRIGYALPAPASDAGSSGPANPSPAATPAAAEGTWEVVRRATTSASGVDAAELIVTVRESGCGGADAQSYIMLVSQYRPPMDRMCLEFPAGLVDGTEAVVDAALRELAEETGVGDGRLGASVRVTRVSAPVCYEPGLCDSTCQMVEVEVALPRGMRAADYARAIREHAELEATEQSLAVVLVPCADLLGEIARLRTQFTVDAKVYSFCVGRATA